MKTRSGNGWSRAVHWMLRVAAGLALLSTNVGCGQKGGSFSALGEQASFTQNASPSQSKVDILWVIDNSGSMDTSQKNLSSNFSRFIEKFNQLEIDFQMAVTTSDAYKAVTLNDPKRSLLKDGNAIDGKSGYSIINALTPNIESVFIKNVLQGIKGSGDERVFQSMRAALENPSNSGFHRSDADLAVVFLSDEDDFSNDGKTSLDSQYDNPALHKISDYTAFLDKFTGSSAVKKYAVHTIGVIDEACRASLSTGPDGDVRKIGKRMMALSDATNGLKESICGDFGSAMVDIAHSILELTTRFQLTEEILPETLRVSINGVEVASNPDNGYTYNATDNTVVFHGSAVPPQGANVQVAYDPKQLH